jgi:ATP-binding cassette subfamily B protein
MSSSKSAAPDAMSTSWGRLLGLARPEAGILSIATVALLLGSSLSLVGPQGVRILTDAVNQPNGREILKTTVFEMMGLFVLVGLFGFLRSWLYTLAGERVVARLRRDLYNRIIAQEIGFFDAQRTGELLNRLSADTNVIQSGVTVNISMALRFFVQALGSVSILLWTSWKLTLVMLAVVPFVAIGAMLFARRVRALSKTTQDALAQASEVADETLGNIRTVRSFAREEFELGRYEGKVNTAFEMGRRLALTYGTFQGAMGFAGFGAVALVLWYGGNEVIDGTLSLGDLNSFMLYTIVLGFSLGALSGLYGDFNRALGASTRVFELMDREPVGEAASAASGAAKGDRLPAIQGRMVLTDVQFAYPTRPDAPVMRNMNLILEPGKVLALVGPSGSGKSTVAALLARFYDPQGGSVTLDGVDLRNLDPKWLREQVGAVSQEPVLFACSIAENIRYGRQDASEADLIAAAKAANAHSFIEGFPEGYQTLVGERGVRLSGGQKQRLAIARAILKNPKILVLDEATSALDAESEHLVQEALERLMVGRTVLIIAHRLSTVRDADTVAVVDKGCVVEAGKHADLVAQDGVYKRLVERQFG